MKDKYSATWLSYSSISDYLKCPRLYYLRNMYRDPKSHHKVSLMQPALALGQVVHDTIESLSRLPTELRFQEPLINTFLEKWQNVTGDHGGFASIEEEEAYKDKGKSMIERVVKHPGPIMNKAIKIRQDLPYYWLSEEENIILCGKIDWLEYFEVSNSVHIIDFKTGKYDEDPDSLQLPIYVLLASNCQSKVVSKASYWYLNRDNFPYEVDLPRQAEAEIRVMEIAKKISLARKLEHLPCSNKEGCRFCIPYEDILLKKMKFVGENDFGQDIYIKKSSK